MVMTSACALLQHLHKWQMLEFVRRQVRAVRVGEVVFAPDILANQAELLDQGRALQNFVHAAFQALRGETHSRIQCSSIYQLLGEQAS